MTRARTNADNVTADIAGITAGTGITGGGTSGTVTITNSMATAFDTKGDLIGATGADTFSKLAVGANNTVLTADSAEATGLKWATPSSGGITLISTTALTGSSVTLSSIPTTYKNLKLIIKSYYASNQEFLSLRLNGDSGGTVYYSNASTLDGGTNSSITGGDNYLPIIYSYNTSSVSHLSFAQIEIPQYTDTSGGQFVTATGYGGVARKGWNAMAIYNNRTAAITSITIFHNTGGTMSGGTVTLYGEA